MAIANGTCVSFCNQSKAYYLATPRESRRYVVAYSDLRVRHLATSRESKAHFGLPWVHGWKEDSILVKRIAACTHLPSTISQ